MYPPSLLTNPAAPASTASAVIGSNGRRTSPIDTPAATSPKNGLVSTPTARDRPIASSRAGARTSPGAGATGFTCSAPRASGRARAIFQGERQRDAGSQPQHQPGEDEQSPLRARAPLRRAGHVQRFERRDVAHL